MSAPPRSRLHSLWLLLTRPGEWSARRYAEKSSMELTALHPERWSAPVDTVTPVLAEQDTRAGAR